MRDGTSNRETRSRNSRRLQILHLISNSPNSPLATPGPSPRYTTRKEKSARLEHLSSKSISRRKDRLDLQQHSNQNQANKVSLITSKLNPKQTSKSPIMILKRLAAIG